MAVVRNLMDSIRSLLDINAQFHIQGNASSSLKTGIFLLKKMKTFYQL